MDDLERLLRASRPEAVVSSRHKQQLDMLLRARMAPAAERLSVGNSLIALALSLLLLIVVGMLAPAPKLVLPQLASDQNWTASAGQERLVLPHRTAFASRQDISLPLKRANMWECLRDRREAFDKANLSVP